MSIESGGEPNPRYDDPRSGSASPASSRTTSATPPGWTRTSCSINADRLAASRASSSTAGSTSAAPLRTAWQLAQAWPDSRLVVLDRSGHTSRRMFEEVFAATEAFADGY